jgi:hypothetical protein
MTAEFETYLHSNRTGPLNRRFIITGGVGGGTCAGPGRGGGGGVTAG